MTEFISGFPANIFVWAVVDPVTSNVNCHITLAHCVYSATNGSNIVDHERAPGNIDCEMLFLCCFYFTFHPLGPKRTFQARVKIHPRSNFWKIIVFLPMDVNLYWIISKNQITLILMKWDMYYLYDVMILLCKSYPRSNRTHAFLLLFGCQMVHKLSSRALEGTWSEKQRYLRLNKLVLVCN